MTTKRYIIQLRDNTYRIFDTKDQVPMWLEPKPSVLEDNNTSYTITNTGNTTITLPPNTNEKIITISTPSSTPYHRGHHGNSGVWDNGPIIRDAYSSNKVDEFDSKDLDYVYNKCKEMNDDIDSWEIVDESLIKELYEK